MKVNTWSSLSRFFLFVFGGGCCKCLAVAVLGTDGPGPSKNENLVFFRMLPVVCFNTALFSLTWQINMCDIALVCPMGISHIPPEGHSTQSILLDVNRARGMANGVRMEN